MKHPIKVMCHGRPTLQLAREFGWLPGARYTNLRDIRGFDQVGLIDIEWKQYDFKRHLAAVRATRPLLTIARDVESARHLDRILDQAQELSCWAKIVVVVPKDPRLGPELAQRIPSKFLLGYSVPTRYGDTRVPVSWFLGRPVHLLGGRPDKQHMLAKTLDVFSIDGNRITLDAQYGDYFAGSSFRPHPSGGYYECIRASLKTVDALWSSNSATFVSLAAIDHLTAIKQLADSMKPELGFVLAPAIRESLVANCVQVAVTNGKLVGYTRFHHRRDQVTKIYEIGVIPSWRQRGVGKQLLTAVIQEARKRKQVRVELKCPEDLSANAFYKHMGFMRSRVERGARRRLFLWSLALPIVSTDTFSSSGFSVS